LNKIDNILDKSLKLDNFKISDVDAEWLSFTKTMSGFEVKDDFRKDNLTIVNFVLRMAAILLLIAIVLPVFKTTQLNENLLVAQKDNEEVILADGSKVVLEKGAEILHYLKLNDVNERKLVLKGNAQLDIAHSILPLRVYTDDITIEVLGTTFTINTAVKGVTEINLTKGKIKASEKKNPSNFVLLNEGDRFFYQNGKFTNPNDTISLMPLPIIEKKTPIKIEEKAENTPKIIEKTINAEEVVLKKFKLESIVKNHLLKHHKNKIKLGKKVKLDYNSIVSINDINKNPELILEDLKKLGLIDFTKGDCDDCFIILSPAQ